MNGTPSWLTLHIGVVLTGAACVGGVGVARPPVEASRSMVEPRSPGRIRGGASAWPRGASAWTTPAPAHRHGELAPTPSSIPMGAHRRRRRQPSRCPEYNTSTGCCECALAHCDQVYDACERRGHGCEECERRLVRCHEESCGHCPRCDERGRR